MESISGYGTIIEDGKELLVGANKISYVIKNEELPVTYTNNVIFCGEIDEQGEITIIDMDDYPTLELCQKIGNFIPIVSNKNEIIFACLTDGLGDPIDYYDNQSFSVEGTINQVNIKAILNELKNNNSLTKEEKKNLFYNSETIIIYGEKNSINKQSRSILIPLGKYELI